MGESAQMNDSKEWYVARGSESIGPLSMGELQSGIQAGQYTTSLGGIG